MTVLGQGFENALEPQNDDDDADILKVMQCFVWSKHPWVKHSFSYLRSKLWTDNVIKKRL